MQRRSLFLISCLLLPRLSLHSFSWSSFTPTILVIVSGTGFHFVGTSSSRTTSKLSKQILLSIRIAFVSATAATVLGSWAGFALHTWGVYRHSAFRPISAPCVPEVITGLSPLGFVEQLIGWPPSRGAPTITIAHIASSMAYVVIIVQSRLTSMDRSLEEAAYGLGRTTLSRRTRHHFAINRTSPPLWLAATTLSMDDLVIASSP